MRQLLQWMIRLVHLLVIWIGWLVLGWLVLVDLVCSQNTDPYQHPGFHNLHLCLHFGNAKNYLLTKLLTKMYNKVEVSQILLYSLGIPLEQT